MTLDNGDTLSYQADITGYNKNEEEYPKLDSIGFKLKYKQINTTTVIEKPITYKQPLITTSPSITAGYDPINKNFGVMVGVSINFNLWNK